MIHNKILKICSRVKDAIRNNSRLQTGFSMLEAVVVVGVLLALAVGGFFAYGPIIQNAKLAKLKSAASQVYTAATVFQVDGDPTTKPQDALDTWNATSTSIKVGFFDTKVVATPAMTTAEGEYTPTQLEDFCIQATDVSKPELEAKSGNCPAPISEVPPSEEPTNEEPPAETVSTSSILKNGDFSEGLKYWTPAAALSVNDLPTSLNGEAVFASGNTRPSILSQTVSIPRSGITHIKYSYRLDASGVNMSNIRINVYDVTGKLLKEVKNTSVPISPAVPITLSTADLTEFAGQDIKLEIHYTNGGYSEVRKMYLDNVSIENTTEAPSAPTGVKATVNVTDATISWNAPSSGTSSVTSYTVTPYRDGSPLAEITSNGAPPATSIVFKGITSGGDYTFAVTATNSIGKSVPSAPSETYSSPKETLKNGDFTDGLNFWTPASTAAADIPTAVDGEAVFKSGNTRLSTLTQTITVPSIGVTYLKYSYRLDSSSNNTSNIRINVYDTTGTFIKEVKKTTIPTGPLVPATLSTADLTEFSGTDIKLEFNYTNGGYSDVRKMYLDNVSIQTVNREPDAPTDVKITTADTDATVTWTLPSTGGSSVTSYTVTPYRNGSPLAEITTTGAPPATSAVFKGMTSGGAYTFTVKATNNLGTSIASVPSDPFLKTTKSLENGDFTAGLAGWKPASVSANDIPTASNGEALFKSGNNRPSTLTQTVSVPANGITQIKYSYRLDASSLNTSNLRVNVYDATGKFIKEVKKTSFPAGPIVPTATTTADLTEFAGQDIKVEFHYTNGGYSAVRNAWLDNVSIERN